MPLRARLVPSRSSSTRLAALSADLSRRPAGRPARSAGGAGRFF